MAKHKGKSKGAASGGGAKGRAGRVEAYRRAEEKARADESRREAEEKAGAEGSRETEEMPDAMTEEGAPSRSWKEGDGKAWTQAIQWEKQLTEEEEELSALAQEDESEELGFYDAIRDLRSESWWEDNPNVWGLVDKLQDLLDMPHEDRNRYRLFDIILEKHDKDFSEIPIDIIEQIAVEKGAALKAEREVSTQDFRERTSELMRGNI